MKDEPLVMGGHLKIDVKPGVNRDHKGEFDTLKIKIEGELPEGIGRKLMDLLYLGIKAMNTKDIQFFESDNMKSIPAIGTEMTAEQQLAAKKESDRVERLRVASFFANVGKQNEC